MPLGARERVPALDREDAEEPVLDDERQRELALGVRKARERDLRGEPRRVARDLHAPPHGAAVTQELIHPREADRDALGGDGADEPFADPDLRADRRSRRSRGSRSRRASPPSRP